MPLSVPTWPELLGSAQHTVVHLEMRDAYAVDYETGPFAEWRAGHRPDPADRASWWRPWLDLISATVTRGVSVRRARIVSEPVSEYTRFLYDGTFTNVAAGEDVRWLARRRASDLALPGTDFWLIDGRLIRWNHFTGDGASVGGEMSEDPAAAKLCGEAFDGVWSRAIPHDRYVIK
ncbi:hypothetical protein OG765_37060 [Streptomyces sp. NBC_00555]|uniref:DUF6879 family protein n=1 Tax=Streptomyces sp. NBC_00555 TaxID=2903662 RepID=UPI00225262F7|nr:DUF6879 family protein [Streptomyces sp. NBC_00555]MCX5014872.1 hypothetical protein [Streptomyces sp. NBC_00555]MCX5016535.1 hypothetical protein [Streptomyces sp. NBC_00555]